MTNIKINHQQLPGEILKSCSRRNLFLSLLTTIILVAMSNIGAKYYLEKYTPNRGDWLIREKWQKLLNLNKPVDWLILGDSSCNQGVVPSVLNEELNTTSVNLCTIGSTTALNDAWMLETYIQKYGPPRHVLIVHVYDLWYRQIQPSTLADIPLSSSDWQKLQPQIPLGLNSKFQMMLEQYFPLYTANQSLSQVIMNPVDSFKLNRSFQLTADGFMVWEESHPENVEAQLKSHIEFTKNNKFSLSEHNSLALQRIIALAEKYDFDVYLANSPIYEGLYKNKDFQVYYREMQKTLSEYEQRSERVHYLMKEPMTFPKKEMENADHLVYSAAKVYTNQIVKEIRHHKQK